MGAVWALDRPFVIFSLFLTVVQDPGVMRDWAVTTGPRNRVGIVSPGPLWKEGTKSGILALL